MGKMSKYETSGAMASGRNYTRGRSVVYVCADSGQTYSPQGRGFEQAVEVTYSVTLDRFVGRIAAGATVKPDIRVVASIESIPGV